MEQFGTLIISVWCFAYFGRARELISTKRVIQRIRGVRRSEAQEIVQQYRDKRSKHDTHEQYQFDFQPDSESLD